MGNFPPIAGTGKLNKPLSMWEVSTQHKQAGSSSVQL